MNNIIKIKSNTYLLLHFAFILAINSVFSQVIEPKMEFIGALQTSDGQYISYKLIFSQDENGKITGHSITDFYGKNCTESYIVGKLNKQENSISFQETKNLTTKSKADLNDFCFVQVNNLKFEQFKGKYFIKGSFKAKFNNGIECAKGKIYLSSAELLEDLKSIAKNKDTLHNEISKFKNSIKEYKTLKSNEVLEINTKEKNIKLIIWDSYLEDNDKVDIYINGHLIQDDFEITQERKTIEIPINSSLTEIKIVAANEGSSANNTLTGFLQNGTQNIPFMTKLKIEQFVLIKIKN